MKTPATSPALATTAVVTMMVVVLVRAFGGPDALVLAIVAAATALTVSGYRTIPPSLRRTSLVLFVLSVLLLPFAEAPLLAIQRGVFVSGQLLAMLASVMFIAQCALRSQRVQAVGAGLREGQPRRRYLSFTIASQMFSGILSMAGAHIMLVMAAPKDEAGSEHRVPTVVAVTRAFSAANFWSPVFGNMAILLALYPSVHWIEIFPIGFGLAQMVLAVGLVLNHLDSSTKTVRAAPPIEETRTTSPRLMRDAFPLLVAMLCFIGLISTVSRLLDISIVPALVLVAPIAALAMHLLISEPGRRLEQGLAGFVESRRLFPRLASEAMLFMAAGCAGSIMASAFPQSWTQQVGQVLGVFPFFGIAFLMLAIMAIGLAGIHPILTAVFLASTITPEVLSLPPLTHMAAILLGWGLSTILTPFSVLSLTAARYAGTTAYQISLEKNWPYALINTLLIALVLTAISLAMQ